MQSGGQKRYLLEEFWKKQIHILKPKGYYIFLLSENRFAIFSKEHVREGN